MHAKKKTLSCIIAIICIMLSSCVTRPRPADELILDYQRKIDRLESTISKYDSAMRNASERLGTITDRSKSMEGTVDDVIRLFDEYQRAVDGLIRDYNEIRAAIEAEQED